MRNPFDENVQLTEEELIARAQRQATVRKNADPALMTHLSRWEQVPMLPPPRPLPMSIRPMKTLFDNLADWYAGYLGVRGEVETPFELSRDLREQVPQSLLRDVYRPIHREVAIDWVQHEIARDPAGQQALAEARAALERPPVEQVQSSLVVMTQVQRYRRRLREQPWRPRHPDEAPRFYSPQQDRFFGDEDIFELDDSSAEGGDTSASLFTE